MIARGPVVAGALAAVVMMTAVTGCGGGRPAPPNVAENSPAIPVAADFSGDGPGTLRSATTLPTVDRRVLAASSIAAKVTYESRSGIDGSDQLVSGTVFGPIGSPPPDGWPVIAFGHSTTGVLHECAPSLSPSLLSASDIVVTLVKAGYVVTVSDYQGLGLDQTYHPYLDAKTEGYNLIDSVRAARKVIPNTSNRWLSFGFSQGGQAAWAANELSATYGQGLNLIGSASLAPAADITGLADLAADGKLSLEQGPVLQWYLVALKNEHPDLNLDDYRRGIVQEKWDVLSACEGPLAMQRSDVAKQITPDDLRPATPAALEKLRGYLEDASLPKIPTKVPMLVLYGGMDELVSAPWTERAINAACDMGDVVEYYLQPSKGHSDIDPGPALDWMAKRFTSNDPPLNTCLVRGQPTPTPGPPPPDAAPQ